MRSPHQARRTVAGIARAERQTVHDPGHRLTTAPRSTRRCANRAWKASSRNAPPARTGQGSAAGSRSRTVATGGATRRSGRYGGRWSAAPPRSRSTARPSSATLGRRDTLVKAQPRVLHRGSETTTASAAEVTLPMRRSLEWQVWRRPTRPRVGVAAFDGAGSWREVVPGSSGCLPRRLLRAARLARSRARGTKRPPHRSPRSTTQTPAVSDGRRRPATETPSFARAFVGEPRVCHRGNPRVGVAGELGYLGEREARLAPA